jgi:superfamily II DNA or RNA helicase
LRANITIYGADAQITGQYPVDTVVDHTSYFKQGYQFMPKYKQGFWDGRIKLFNKRKQTFPAGLVSYVQEALEEEGVKVQIEDQRCCPAIAPVTQEITLHGVSFDYPYDFQLDCMEQMILNKRGVVAVATSGGKTEIACLVTACLRLPTLFMVPGKELLYQTRDRFATRLGVDVSEIGIIGDGHWDPRNWITVATVASVYKSLEREEGAEYLNCIDLLFYDECHKIGSDSWFITSRACNAFFRFGLSGTPLKRTDGADLRLLAATGPIIYEVRNKHLIERGISSEVEIQMVPIHQPFIPEKTPYQDVYKAGIVDNLVRNRILCTIAAGQVEEGRKVIILVKEIDHGHEIDSRMWSFRQKSFISHQFINGQESSEVRREALENFKKGDLSVLIATAILDEGVDLPNIDTLILAGGGKSSIKTLQRIGRGLRLGGIDNRLIVIDTADYQHRYLLEHSLQRLTDYKAEECFDIKEWKEK